MGESAKVVGVGADPDGLVWNAAEVMVFKSLACLGVNDGVGSGAVVAGVEQITRASRIVGVGRNDVAWERSGLCQCGAGSAAAGTRCVGATL